MYSLYKWSNLKPDSPQGQTRNQWLYQYGAFARKDGRWFPCKVLQLNMLGNPATLTAVPIGTFNVDLYPQGQILATDCEVIYSIFGNGMSLFAHVRSAMRRKTITDTMLDAALKRSLNTELLHAPKKLMGEVKKAANRANKEEQFVINSSSKDEIGVIQLPRTIEIVEKLWNSNDWAIQEVSQLLGISYNPAHGKKERMISNELLGDRDLTIMNREMITERLITAAEAFGETVVHISTEIDAQDRQLSYGNPNPIEREEKPDDGNSNI